MVNMWHGVPLKRFGYMVSEKQWFNLSRMFTYVCVNSDNLVGVMKASFRCQDEQIVVNGNPRCDYLFQKSNYIQAMESLRGNWKKTIIWLPTYRKSIDGTEDSAQCAQFQDTDSLHKLNDYLLCKDVLLIIKPHPLQRADEVTVSEMSNIKFIDNGLLCSNHIPLYSLLGETDALITDYSSVFADYLLINKPIAFMVDDMDSYAGKRGFSFDDPLNYMPGIKIRNQAEILGFIDSVLVGKDEWCEERNRVCSLLNQYKDGRNAERLVDIIIRKVD
ncbi:hypothetical protein AGMMS49992_20930 [Clostridia bacterium]|nr:hypothetical protein AGMMS49992_20930 [Clostridia bacterium]